MTEAQVIYALWGATLALVAAVWGMLREQNRRQGQDIAHLETQNGEQEKEIARLKERMLAREEAHAVHRQDTSDALANFRADMHERFRGIDSKLDMLLGRGARSLSPYPQPQSGERKT